MSEYSCIIFFVILPGLPLPSSALAINEKEAIKIANKIGIMYGGQMVEFDSSEEIYKNPKHPYTQGLLKSIPTLKGDIPKYIKGIPPSLLDAPTECRFIDRCPLVIEKCKQLPPKFKTDTGYVRCWLYEDK